jgi:threonine dehydrogenase-like Zn-dependent dehydrogenase
MRNEDQVLQASLKPKTYKAAIYRGIDDVDVVELPYPVCGDDEIIVRNIMTGICGSDIYAFRNGGDDYMIWKDHEFGHETISEVIEIGCEVVGLTVGDHVFPNQGKALRDPKRMTTVGGFSEYIRIPKCEVGYSVLKIDNDIPIRTAVLFEPLVIATRGAINLNPQRGQTAIVFGAGIIGMCTAVMLKWYGCAKVMIVDISDFRLEKAKALGLIPCNSAKEDLKAKAFAEFGTRSGFFGERCAADLYVDAIGLTPAIENFMALAGRDATLAVLGVHHAPVALDLMALCYSNWRVIGSGSLPIEDAMNDILAMMRSKKYDLTSLVSHEYKVDDIRKALLMGASVGEAQKVCVSF